MKRILPEYEHRSQPLIPINLFLRRVLYNSILAFTVIAVSLLIGMVGYHVLEELSWMDAFLNSAMLLGGMGPVNPPHTDGGKLFAGLYALYAGLVFIVSAALIFTPIVHRLLHKFHWNSKL